MSPDTGPVSTSGKERRGYSSESSSLSISHSLLTGGYVVLIPQCDA